MSQGAEEDDDRTHDPTAKRLDDARKKGDIAKSTDLSAAAGYMGLLLAGVMSGGVLITAFQAGASLLGQAPMISSLASTGARSALAGPLLAFLAVPALFLGLPALASLLALVAQRAIVVAPDKLIPKLARINPLANARQKFGMEGIVEFLKSAVKMGLVGFILVLFFRSELGGFILTAALDPAQGLLVLWHGLGSFLALVTLITLGIGALDLLWQRHALIKRNRMSRKDLMDEMKEQDGDPHARAARRQRGQDIAMNQMLADVPAATVVIVNPTHFAVALKWQRGSGHPPMVVAKGVDEVALQIRKVATEAGVPIHSDPPTARAIHATVPIGQPIQRGHFEAVAAAIRFAEALRKKSRKPAL
jgi:flagellar biosynthetic protein FlhB